MFRKGDIVVYPQQGPALVEKLVDLPAGTKTATYYRLRVLQGNLAIMVPVQGAAQVGLRSVASKTAAEKVLRLMGEPPRDASGEHWSARFKQVAGNVRSGELEELAAVVRDLYHRRKKREHSASEWALYRRARQMLVSELALALHRPQEKTDATVDRILEHAAF